MKGVRPDRAILRGSATSTGQAGAQPLASREGTMRVPGGYTTAGAVVGGDVYATGRRDQTITRSSEPEPLPGQPWDYGDRSFKLGDATEAKQAASSACYTGG